MIRGHLIYLSRTLYYYNDNFIVRHLFSSSKQVAVEQIFKMSVGSEHEKHEQYQKSIKENENILKDLGINESDGLWVFGYGSLVWKTNFEYDKKVKGYIKGYVRRFWQKSTDHRGTLALPGRVATLVHADDDEQKLWGFAYHVPQSHLTEAINILNFREKGGYSLKKIQVHTNECATQTSEPIEVLIYVALQGNHDYGGNERIEDIALQIAKANGPSGPNTEYLFNLANALKKENMYTIDDEQHTLELSRKVKCILENNNNN